MSDKIITYKDFDPSRIVYKPPKENGHGGSIIPAMYNCPKRGEIPILVTTPKMKMPFGVSQYPPAKDEPDPEIVKFTADLSFNGHDNDFKEDKDVGVFFNKMMGVEKHRNQFLYKNSKKFLGKAYKSVDILEAICNPVVKFDEKHGKYPPKISAKMRRDKKDKKKEIFLNTFSNMKVYTTANKHTPVNVVAFKSENGDAGDSQLIADVIPHGSEGRGLLYAYGLTVVSGKVSMPWTCKQIMVYPGQDDINENVFANMSDDEDEPDVPVTESAFADDSEEEDDTPAPAQASKKTKKKPVVEDKAEEASESDEEVEVEVDASDEEEVEVTDDDSD